MLALSALANGVSTAVQVTPPSAVCNPLRLALLTIRSLTDRLLTASLKVMVTRLV
ncbi:hypothetical protein D3C76_1834870 [compost metagenome]